MEKDLFDLPIVEHTEEYMNMLHTDFVRSVMANSNNFSYWFPKIRSVRKHGIYVPKSFVIFIPYNVYMAFMGECDGDKDRIVDWYDDCVYPMIENNFPEGEFFVKNGCFSNKFEFSRSCHILKTDIGEDIVRKISYMMYMSICHETKGYLELVLREWITPPEGTKTIYEGMPFRPEMRVFYDFNQKKVLYKVNYWDWDYCHDAICLSCDGDKKPDADVYEQEYSSENEQVEVLGAKYMPVIEKALADVNLIGIWSVDFILEQDRVILIDMALARMSAYWDESKIKGGTE